MKEALKIALCNTNQTPLAWDSNYSNLKNAILNAKENGLNLILFPELALTSASCGNFFHYPYIQDFCFDILNKILPLSNDIAIVIGLPLRLNDKTYNTCCILKDGKILGFVPKSKLSSSPLINESSFFSSWNNLENIDIEILKEKYPVSPNLIFNIQGYNITIKIGDDIKDASCISDSVNIPQLSN